MSFEYKLVSSVEELNESFLNSYGVDGWQLVQWQLLPQVDEQGDPAGNYFHYVFVKQA